MLIVKPYIFQPFDDLVFGFSTMGKDEFPDPFNFNLSFNIGDNEKKVLENRMLFSEQMGIDYERIAFHKQIHSDIIHSVEQGGFAGEGDALITDKKRIALAISAADCAGIFLYEPKEKIIAAVHSGWRGTEKKILLKTISHLQTELKINPNNLVAYIAPSISQINYEVGSEFQEKFPTKYSMKISGKFYLDVAEMNYDYLIQSGVKPSNIQKSKLCTFLFDDLLHSYRRDGETSGRALGILAMK